MYIKITHLKLFAVVASMCIAAAARADSGSVTAESDNWMLTDALGRKACSYSEAGDRNTDRYVGMFYWTWHQGYDFNGGVDDANMEVRNITEVLREYPEAINDFDHPAWGGKKKPGVFYWDEPLFGYYRTTDPWVLRKHAEMLADAGIDFIFMDCTNGSFVWEYSYRALLETWQQALDDGVNVPKICFLLPFSASDDSKMSLLHLYNKLYSKGEYKDLWFYWDGKPLVMAYNTNMTVTEKERTIREFFTYRPCQPDYVNGPSGISNQWGWLEVYPTHGFNTDWSTGKPEQCVVGVAQNARAASGGHCCAFNLPNTYGRSYSKTKGFDTRSDGYLYGWNFQEQWDRAINTLKPKVVSVTGWNEWTSGMWRKKDGWSDPLSFVDQFDWDHSRDIEPTKGWGDKGDVYYQQLVDNVRRFKGMSAPAGVSPQKTIVLGEAGQWDDVLPRYKAYRGNTFHRDHKGRYERHYVDNSGRNDIVGAQVAHDNTNIYFLVETADALTPSSDPNWMMLFIDIDRDRSTGWNGYDYVINRTSPTSDAVYVESAVDGEWKWAEKGNGQYAVNGNVLEIALPKSLLGVGDNLDFEFKWSDNLQSPGDIMDFYVSGDCAPGGRFNYVYNTAYTSSVSRPAADSPALKAVPVGGLAINVESDASFTVVNLTGTVIATGNGSGEILLPAAGMYVVYTAYEAVKVLVR